MTKRQVRSNVGALRKRTNQPFNPNFFVGEAPVTHPVVLARTRDRLCP